MRSIRFLKFYCTASREELNTKVCDAIKEALSGFEYETCPLVTLGVNRPQYDKDGVRYVVNSVKLVSVEKMRRQTNEKRLTLIAENVCDDREWSIPTSVTMEEAGVDPVEVLDCIGKITEYMEIEKF